MSVFGGRVFDFRYAGVTGLMTALGLGPKRSRIEVGGDEVRVVMGWGFRARIPRSSIKGANASSGPAGGIGVHGWRGRWLVNGSTDNLVDIEIDPPVRAVAVGFPVKLRLLRVSAEDPDGLVAALSRRPAGS